MVAAGLSAQFSHQRDKERLDSDSGRRSGNSRGSFAGSGHPRFRNETIPVPHKLGGLGRHCGVCLAICSDTSAASPTCNNGAAAYHRLGDGGACRSKCAVRNRSIFPSGSSGLRHNHSGGYDDLFGMLYRLLYAQWFCGLYRWHDPPDSGSLNYGRHIVCHGCSMEDALINVSVRQSHPSGSVRKNRAEKEGGSASFMVSKYEFVILNDKIQKNLFF